MAVEIRRLGLEARRPPARTVRAHNPRLRVLAIGLVVAVLAGAVWTRLVYWQVVQHQELSRWAASQYEH